MDTDTNTPELTMEDRLKAIAYQFIALYERWSEDRQVAAKQGADTAELVKLFAEQVKNFKELEPKVRQHLAASIQNATTTAAEKIGETIGKEASRATEQVTRQLANATERTERTLNQYEREIVTSQWKIIGIAVITTVVTCLLALWWIIPKPTLPLSDRQLKYATDGILMEQVWPKLSKQEQAHWLKLADEVTHPASANASDNNPENAEDETP